MTININKQTLLVTVSHHYWYFPSYSIFLFIFDSCVVASEEAQTLSVSVLSYFFFFFFLLHIILYFSFASIVLYSPYWLSMLCDRHTISTYYFLLPPPSPSSPSSSPCTCLCWYLLHCNHPTLVHCSCAINELNEEKKKKDPTQEHTQFLSSF